MSINEVNAFEWVQNGVYANYMRNLYETGRAVGPNTMVTAPSPEIGRDDSAQMSSETLIGDNGRKSPDSLLGAFATAWGKGVADIQTAFCLAHFPLFQNRNSLLPRKRTLHIQTPLRLCAHGN